jgi:hypothetical protein
LIASKSNPPGQRSAFFCGDILLPGKLRDCQGNAAAAAPLRHPKTSSLTPITKSLRTPSFKRALEIKAALPSLSGSS